MICMHEHTNQILERARDALDRVESIEVEPRSVEPGTEWQLAPPSKRSAPQRGLTDAQLLRMVHEIIDCRTDVLVQVLGEEIGDKHRALETDLVAQIAELRASVAAQDDKIVRLQDAFADLQAQVQGIADDVVENSASKPVTRLHAAGARDVK